MNAKAFALVTGANKGIGREIARQLAARGIVVWLGARDTNRGEEAAASLVPAAAMCASSGSMSRTSTAFVRLRRRLAK
jgi:NAD(P)-dependent dehydrogenase (short-subunit alcohol dehydrogenase family)